MNSTIKLIHITDLHLGDSLGDQLSSVDCDASLLKVMSALEDEEFDALLITGDIANNGAISSYQRLQKYLQVIEPRPFYMLPGNHDNWPNAEKVFGSQAKQLVFGKWQLLLLDSNQDNKHFGQLSTEELNFLEASLADTSVLYSLITLHHPPVDIGSPWMDAMQLKNKQAFFDIIERYDSPQAVLWGHIHQEFDQSRQGVRLLSSPSTCTQFLPQTMQHQNDPRPPGFRRIELGANGEVKTDVVRLSE